MIRLLTLVLILATEPTGFVAGQDEAFEPAKVNKWIVALSEDPTQDNDVGELHAYLKKHGKLGLVVLKFEESFDRRPKDAKIRYLLGRLHLRDGNRAAALKCFQSAAQADPEDCGRAPPLALRAIWSLANGGGKWSAMRPGRWNISP